MSSLIATIKLREAATNQAVEAYVFDGIDQTHLSNWKTKWVPVVKATEARLLAQGASASAYPQSAHWDWNKKSAAFQNLLSYRMFAITCAQDTQGLMAVATDVVMHPSRLPDDKGRRGLGLVYIDFLEAAPWNRPEHVRSPRYRGVGSMLIMTAIQLSFDEGFKGRIGLHSLPQSEDFYRNVVRMTDLGPDTTYPGSVPLRYFEFTSAQAQAFIKGGKP